MPPVRRVCNKENQLKRFDSGCPTPGPVIFCSGWTETGGNIAHEVRVQRGSGLIICLHDEDAVGGDAGQQGHDVALAAWWRQIAEYIVIDNRV